MKIGHSALTAVHAQRAVVLVKFDADKLQETS
jgi:hypothetical protein